MPITIITASLLALWLVILSLRVIKQRRALGRNTPDAAQEQALKRAIRGQGNLTEYAPIFLLLLFLAEYNAQAQWFLALVAVLFLAGRLAHGVAFSFMRSNMLLRVGGMVLTLTSLILLAVANLLMLV